MINYQLNMPENTIYYDVQYVPPITFSKTPKYHRYHSC